MDVLVANINNGSYVKMIGSKMAQAARTPPSFLHLVKSIYFPKVQVHDPCPVAPRVDGLQSTWRAHNFVNPPFIDVKSWLLKAIVERKHTVLLFPARTSTEYMHFAALIHCSSVVIWTNSFTFPPFTKYFSLPMMTVELGTSRLHSMPALTLRPVNLDRWTVPDMSLTDRLHWLKETALTRFKVKHINNMGTAVRALRMGTTGVSWVPVTHSPTATMTVIQDHVRKYHKSTIVAMVIPSFNSEWFRSSQTLIRQIVFVTPRLVFHDGKLSPLGTVLIVYSARRLRLSCVNPCPPTYLATWNGGKHFV